MALNCQRLILTLQEVSLIRTNRFVTFTGKCKSTEVARPIRCVPSCVVATALMACVLTLCVVPNAVAEAAQSNSHEVSLFERVREAAVAPSEIDMPVISVRGVVRNPDYSPAVNAIVFGTMIDAGHDQIVAKALTDREGNYSFSIPVRSSDRIEIYAIDSHNRIGWHTHQFIGTSVGTLKRSLDLAFLLTESSGRIEGELVTSAGTPITATKVKVLGLLSERFGHCTFSSDVFRFNATSDEQGRFQIVGLPNNTTAHIAIDSNEWSCLPTLIGNSEQHESKFSSRSSAKFHSGFARIEVLKKILLAGKVVDDAGNPVAGTHIDPERSGSNIVTDSEGAFTLPSIDIRDLNSENLKNYSEFHTLRPPQGSRFVAKSFIVNRDQVISGKVSTIVLDGTLVSGQVLSAKYKYPLENIQVTYSMDQTAVTNELGKFELAVPYGPQTIQFAPHGLSAREKKLFLEASQNRASRPLDIVGSNSVDMGKILLDIQPNGGKPVTIRIVTTEGNPVQNCQVILSQSSSGQPNDRIDGACLIHESSIRRSVATSADGIAVVRPLLGWMESSKRQTATNVISVFYPTESPTHFATLELPNEISSETYELTLRKGDQYSGTILLNGSPLPNVEVKPHIVFGQNSLSEFLRAKTNDKGKYSLFVPPKVKCQSISSINFPSTYYSLAVNYPILLARVAEAEYAFDDVQLVSGIRQLSGIVVDSSGMPVNAHVSCKCAGKTIVNVNSVNASNGKFLFTNLPDLPLTLQITAPGGRKKATVEVAKEQTEIRIELE